MKFFLKLLLFATLLIYLNGCGGSKRYKNSSSDSSAGNSANKVKDTEAPHIKLNGAKYIRLEQGQEYIEKGAIAIDNVDGMVAVTKRGSVDNMKIGVYKIIYTAEDKAGNRAEATRVVTVVEKPNQPPIANAGEDFNATNGEIIVLDGSASSDPDGEIVEYKWMENSTILGNKSTIQLENLHSGTHTFVLTVTDDKGATAQDEVIVIMDKPSEPKLKKTGQTKSYDENGNSVTDGSVKDDGYYQTGFKLDYIRDDNKDIVTDNVTGLMWQDNEDVKTVLKPWLTQENYDKCAGENGETQDIVKCYDTSGDTAATYCANLTLGGYSNWRLPTIDELMYIANRSKVNPSIDDIFKNIAYEQYWYWSSSTFIKYENNGWLVGFDRGYGIWNIKSNQYGVRCVREK